MACAPPVQITLLWTSSPETSLFSTLLQNLLFYFYYNSSLSYSFFVCTYKLHYLSLPSHTPQTFPNLAWSLISLVQNFTHCLAITSDTVHEDIWNLRVPNLEGRNPQNYYMLFTFHYFTYILFLPIFFDKQKYPPDFTDVKSFFSSCHPTLFARQVHTYSFELCLQTEILCG